MQAMLATLVGHFELTPGLELQKHLATAAAAAPVGQDAGDDGDAGVHDGSGLNPVAVLNALSVHHVTLQSKNGMVLRFEPRR
jgi:hypothetical protein